ncbi:transcriptional regulator BetI [Rhodovibrionaceae bacterium A322]
MPKVGMEEIRRRQLIEATIDTIHEAGFAKASVMAISRRAGLSAGLVAHYFKDKDGLLEATLRHISNDLSQDFITRLRKAQSPRARLEAIIASNLGAEQFDSRTTEAWLAFWGQAPHSPRLLRVQKINERRLLSNLRYAATQLLPRDEAEFLANSLAALIDGLYLRAALSGMPPNPLGAQQQANQLLDLCLEALSQKGVSQPALQEMAT